MELYDLGTDLSEANNVAASNPEKVKALEASLVKLLEETEAKFPIPNPGYKGKK